MFGGFGLYRDGMIFGILRSDGDIYLKCDEKSVEEFRAAGSHAFAYSKDGRRFTMSYWSLPSEALDDSDALTLWAGRAFEAALRGAKAKKPRQRPEAAATEDARSRGRRRARSAPGRKAAKGGGPRRERPPKG
jgi:DNA transformation protein and related proteins